MCCTKLRQVTKVSPPVTARVRPFHLTFAAVCSSISPYVARRDTRARHHAFHPWKGREFSLVSYRKNWGEDRVFFENGGNTLVSLPARWTDVLSPDPFVAISQGRSPFRTDDLLELAELLRRIDGKSPERGPGDV